MCNNHLLHHLFLTFVQILDHFILSNPALLTRLHSNFPSLFRILLSLLKALACWLSGGKSWFNRICADRRNWNTQKGRVIQLIAIHLRNSHSLKAEAKLIFYSPPEVTIDLDRLTKIIALKKKIPFDSESFGILKEALAHIIQLERLISHVIKRARSPFDKSQDLVSLQSLWTNLHSVKTSTESNSDNAHTIDNNPPGIPDKRWQELGFQGSDPGTDFRGMGLLGLDQLLAYTQISPKSAHNLWQQSKLGSAWFTFATVGINITALLYSLLVSHSADQHFYSAPLDGILAFNQAYRIVFEKFGEYWVMEDAKDVMDFSRIFGKLRTDIERNLETHGTLFPTK